MIERYKDYTENLDLPLSFDDKCILLTSLANDFKFVLNKDATCTDGSTRDEYGHIVNVQIGCRETFDSNCDTLFAFIAPIVSIYHENAHVQQICKMSQSNDPLSACILLNHYACKCSYDYYLGHFPKNYFMQTKEIAAQYVALHGAYRYFETLFDDERLANDIICAYVNTRIGLRSEFIMSDEPYMDISEVFSDFEQKFDVVKNKHKKLSFENMSDDFSSYLHKHASVGDKIKVAINNITSNQDLLLTSIYIKEANEGEFVRNLRCFDDVSFPYDDISVSRASYFDNDVRLSDMFQFENKDSNDYQP